MSYLQNIKYSSCLVILSLYKEWTTSSYHCSVMRFLFNEDLMISRCYNACRFQWYWQWNTWDFDRRWISKFPFAVNRYPVTSRQTQIFRRKPLSQFQNKLLGKEIFFRKVSPKIYSGRNLTLRNTEEIVGIAISSL